MTLSKEIINIYIITSAEVNNILFYVLSYVAFCLSWSFYCLIYLCMPNLLSTLHEFFSNDFNIPILFNLIFPRLSS